MSEDIGGTIVGIIIVIIGVMNMRGNISTLHYYHRKHVSEENKRPFGRMVGLGTIIMGAAVILFGALSLITCLSKMLIFKTVGVVLLVVGLIVGAIIMFYAIKKYNGRIF